MGDFALDSTHLPIQNRAETLDLFRSFRILFGCRMVDNNPGNISCRMASNCSEAFDSHALLPWLWFPADIVLKFEIVVKSLRLSIVLAIQFTQTNAISRRSAAQFSRRKMNGTTKAISSTRFIVVITERAQLTDIQSNVVKRASWTLYTSAFLGYTAVSAFRQFIQIQVANVNPKLIQFIS